MSNYKKIVQYLITNLEWDGYGYWTPGICVKKWNGRDFCAEPTKEEFIEFFLNKLGENE